MEYHLKILHFVNSMYRLKLCSALIIILFQSYLHVLATRGLLRNVSHKWYHFTLKYVIKFHNSRFINTNIVIYNRWSFSVVYYARNLGIYRR